MNTVGLAAPINLGRYFRMTTSSAIDLRSTFAIAGEPKIAFDQGLRETVAWLQALDPVRFTRRG
jgi:hypothetical protein